MQQIILSRLANIETSENIKIVYACESGSRAWGFPSQDSDYDVRYIYFRPIEWYLSIDDKKDVLEAPIYDQLDINGWDIKKGVETHSKNQSSPFGMAWFSNRLS